jgi:hypothetical protein
MVTIDVNLLPVKPCVIWVMVIGMKIWKDVCVILMVQSVCMDHKWHVQWFVVQESYGMKILLNADFLKNVKNTSTKTVMVTACVTKDLLSTIKILLMNSCAWLQIMNNSVI